MSCAKHFDSKVGSEKSFQRKEMEETANLGIRKEFQY